MGTLKTSWWSWIASVIPSPSAILTRRSQAVLARLRSMNSRNLPRPGVGDAVCVLFLPSFSRITVPKHWREIVDVERLLQMSEEYHEGFNSFTPIETNPYTYGSLEWFTWREGWLDSHEEVDNEIFWS
jgi:hypothetical protein